MTTIKIPYDIERAGLTERYIELIEVHGNSPRMAEMLAMRQPPRCLTDDVIMAGVGTLDQQIKDPQQLNAIVTAARKKGYNPKPTDFYNQAVATEIGDPKAFINHGQGRSHVKKTLEERGMGGEGMVNVKSREPEHDPHEKPVHRLNPKIVNRIRDRKITENPDLARQDQAELVHSIVERHGWNESK